MNCPDFNYKPNECPNLISDCYVDECGNPLPIYECNSESCTSPGCLCNAKPDFQLKEELRHIARHNQKGQALLTLVRVKITQGDQIEPFDIYDPLEAIIFLLEGAKLEVLRKVDENLCVSCLHWLDPECELAV